MKNPFAKDWRLCKQVVGCDSEGIFTQHYVYDTTPLTWFEAVNRSWKVPENSGFPYGIYVRHVEKLEHYIPREEIPDLNIEKGKNFLSSTLINKSVKFSMDQNPENEEHYRLLRRKMFLAVVILMLMVSCGIAGFIAKYPYRMSGICNSVVIQDDCLKSKMGNLNFKLADTGELLGLGALAVLCLPLIVFFSTPKNGRTS